MPKRVLIAGLFHETNTFLEGQASLSEFRILKRAELFNAEGDDSPLDGCLQTARQAGWEVVPAVDMRAMPGPVVEDQVSRVFWREFLSVATSDAGRNVDGILLVLQGAMVSQSCDDIEGEILERIYNLYGATMPIVGVIDLHANFSPRMARYSSALVAYRENPHSDARESAMRAARLLDRFINSREQPETILEHSPVMWPPTATATAVEPMSSLEAMARQIENEDQRILTVNVLAGFPFADVREAGVSFTAVVVGKSGRARKMLQHLVSRCTENRELGNIVDPPTGAVMKEIASMSEGPIVVAEPSDNIGAGAPGNGTGLLRALIEESTPGAVVTLNEPEAVQHLCRLKKGERTALIIGRNGSRYYPPPLQLEVELVSTSNGSFELADPHSHLASLMGKQIEMGPCAVVRHHGISILITTRRTPPFDLNQLRSQGIEPEKAFLIGVKAAVAHRKAYGPIAKHSYTVDTPGPCSSNLKTFEYRKVRRPIYPLDVHV